MRLTRIALRGRDPVLLDQHDEPGALWTYASVLLALRAHDQRLARRRLRAEVRRR